MILPEHLPKRVLAGTPTEESSHPSDSMADIERDAILKTLKEQGFHRTNTAKALGISRRALTYKLRTYRAAGFDIDKPA